MRAAAAKMQRQFSLQPLLSPDTMDVLDDGDGDDNGNNDTMNKNWRNDRDATASSPCHVVEDDDDPTDYEIFPDA